MFSLKIGLPAKAEPTSNVWMAAFVLAHRRSNPPRLRVWAGASVQGRDFGCSIVATWLFRKMTRMVSSIW